MTATAVAHDEETTVIQAPRFFYAVGDRVVLKPIGQDGEQKIGSILVPEVAREKPQEAEVIAFGESAHGDCPRLFVGARVLYGKYSGTEVTVDGQDLLIMHAKDLLLVFG
jgi:chaperonin GroES